SACVHELLEASVLEADLDRRGVDHALDLAHAELRMDEPVARRVARLHGVALGREAMARDLRRVEPALLPPAAGRALGRRGDVAANGGGGRLARGAPAEELGGLSVAGRLRLAE